MRGPRNEVFSLFSHRARQLNGHVCKSCRKSIAQRSYASSAAAIAEQPLAASSTIPPVAEAASPKLAFQVRTGVVLSRPPQITRDLTPFEKSFFLYQRRLNERLALPFTQYFYFRKGTPALLDWKRKIKTRRTPARDIGSYNPYQEDGWNDELLVGARESEPEHQVEALLKDSIPLPTNKDSLESAQKSEEQSIERPMPRITASDLSNDLKSLDRLLQRTLYLLVQNSKGRWTFPSDIVTGRESLQQAAERILVQSAGVNMNTWIVGNSPVGFLQHKHPKAITNLQGMTQLGEKTFFMKARIMAGQANVNQNKLNVKDFRWLAKEEIEKTVSERYWASIRNMLPEK